MSEVVPLNHNEDATVATILARPGFEDLLGLAADTCLRNPGAMERYRSELAADRQAATNPDAQLLRTLGLQGVSAAFNLATCFNLPRGAICDPETAAHSLDEVVRHPRQFSANIDPAVQDAIEALGHAMVDEAFLCLGEDATKKAEEFRTATDVKGQIAVCTWLSERVCALANQDVTSEELHEAFYFPTRLSPKLIGTYPNQQLRPTCLGASILVASFFEKAGAVYLHAGVAEASFDAARRRYETALSLAPQFAEDWGMPLPAETVRTYNDAVRQSIMQRTRDDGYHAAVVVRLRDGTWGQVDPILNSDQVLPPPASPMMEGIYGDLLDISRLVPGTELMYEYLIDMPTLFLTDSLKALGGKGPSPEQIEAFLANETLSLSALAKRFIEPAFFGDLSSKGLSSRGQTFLRSYFENISARRNPQTNTMLDDLMKETVRARVFGYADGVILEQCFARCQTDAAYRTYCAENLRRAPIYFFARAISELTNYELSTHNHCHTRLEVGLPHYRIGACVLSDFAVYTGDELPTSFWISHWPSAVNLTEHRPGPAQPGQEAIFKKLACLATATGLKYSRCSVIMD